jgi:hypothetical protein
MKICEKNVKVDNLVFSDGFGVHLVQFCPHSKGSGVIFYDKQSAFCVFWSNVCKKRMINSLLFGAKLTSTSTFFSKIWRPESVKTIRKRRKSRKSEKKRKNFIRKFIFFIELLKKCTFFE